MDDGDTKKIDTILKNFLEEMDKLEEQYHAIISEAKQSEVSKNNA